jgi:pterin-4a-carbinolamine dehydratase
LSNKTTHHPLKVESYEYVEITIGSHDIIDSEPTPPNKRQIF